MLRKSTKQRKEVENEGVWGWPFEERGQGSVFWSERSRLRSGGGEVWARGPLRSASSTAGRNSVSLRVIKVATVAESEQAGWCQTWTQREGLRVRVLMWEAAIGEFRTGLMLIRLFLKYPSLKHHSGCHVESRLQVVENEARRPRAIMSHTVTSPQHGGYCRVQAAGHGGFHQSNRGESGEKMSESGSFLTI